MSRVVQVALVGPKRAGKSTLVDSMYLSASGYSNESSEIGVSPEGASDSWLAMPRTFKLTLHETKRGRIVSSELFAGIGLSGIADVLKNHAWPPTRLDVYREEELVLTSEGTEVEWKVSAYDTAGHSTSALMQTIVRKQAFEEGTFVDLLRGHLQGLLLAPVGVYSLSPADIKDSLITLKKDRPKATVIASHFYNRLKEANFLLAVLDGGTIGYPACCSETQHILDGIAILAQDTGARVITVLNKVDLLQDVILPQDGPTSIEEIYSGLRREIETKPQLAHSLLFEDGLLDDNTLAELYESQGMSIVDMKRNCFAIVSMWPDRKSPGRSLVVDEKIITLGVPSLMAQ